MSSNIPIDSLPQDINGESLCKGNATARFWKNTLTSMLRGTSLNPPQAFSTIDNLSHRSSTSSRADSFLTAQDDTDFPKIQYRPFSRCVTPSHSFKSRRTSLLTCSSCASFPSMAVNSSQMNPIAVSIGSGGTSTDNSSFDRVTSPSTLHDSPLNAAVSCNRTSKSIIQKSDATVTEGARDFDVGAKPGRPALRHMSKKVSLRDKVIPSYVTQGYTQSDRPCICQQRDIGKVTIPYKSDGGHSVPSDTLNLGNHNSTATMKARSGICPTIGVGTCKWENPSLILSGNVLPTRTTSNINYTQCSVEHPTLAEDTSLTKHCSEVNHGSDLHFNKIKTNIQGIRSILTPSEASYIVAMSSTAYNKMEFPRTDQKNSKISNMSVDCSHSFSSATVESGNDSSGDSVDIGKGEAERTMMTAASVDQNFQTTISSTVNTCANKGLKSRETSVNKGPRLFPKETLGDKPISQGGSVLCANVKGTTKLPIAKTLALNSKAGSTVHYPAIKYSKMANQATVNQASLQYGGCDSPDTSKIIGLQQAKAISILPLKSRSLLLVQQAGRPCSGKNVSGEGTEMKSSSVLSNRVVGCSRAQSKDSARRTTIMCTQDDKILPTRSASAYNELGQDKRAQENTMEGLKASGMGDGMAKVAFYGNVEASKTTVSLPLSRGRLREKESSLRVTSRGGIGTASSIVNCTGDTGKVQNRGSRVYEKELPAIPKRRSGIIERARRYSDTFINPIFQMNGLSNRRNASRNRATGGERETGVTGGPPNTFRERYGRFKRNAVNSGTISPFKRSTNASRSSIASDTKGSLGETPNYTPSTRPVESRASNRRSFSRLSYSSTLSNASQPFHHISKAFGKISGLKSTA